MKKFFFSMLLAFALLLGINNNASANVLNNDLELTSTEIVTNELNIAPTNEADAESISVEIEITIDKDGVEVKIKIKF